MNHPRAYDLLDQLHILWGRKDSSHIFVWTSGYKTHFPNGHYGIETHLMPLGFRMIDESWHPDNGQTQAIYRHKVGAA